MKYFLLLIFFFEFSSAAFAQNNTRPGSIPASGHLYGKVTDENDAGLAHASVMLMTLPPDSARNRRPERLIKATVSKANGEFSLENLPAGGAMQLLITAIGYKTFKQPFSFIPKGPTGMRSAAAPPQKNNGSAQGFINPFDKDIGNIKLFKEVKNLQTVTVTSAAPLLKLDTDKKVFQVSRNITAAGGTAVEVLRNVPSVQVDVDGNVRVRNATPQIYLNGRPSALLPDQVPASEIEQVEVITNPSAKYDASGGHAGIINLVLKKNKATGYNGMLSAGADSRGGFNAGGNFNVKTGKFNFSLSAFTNQIRNRTTGSTQRMTRADTALSVSQTNLNKTTGGFTFGKLGIDYFITNRTTLSFTATQTYGQFKPAETIDIRVDTLFDTGIKSFTGSRYASGNRKITGSSFQLSAKHNFPRPGREWTADITYSTRNVDGTGFIDTYPHPSTWELLQQKNNMKARVKLLVAQTDYINPVSTGFKLETGIRMQLNPITNDNENFIRIPPGDFEKIDAATTLFKTHNTVYAAYANASGQLNQQLHYQLGLRAESSKLTGAQTHTGDVFKTEYPISLFPSLFLNMNLKKEQQLQFSATRKINRPSFYQLTPYTDYTDELNITRGNPGLTPEFITSTELSYIKKVNEKNTVLASVYYKYISHLIARYLVAGENPLTGKATLISTFVNTGAGERYGAELTSVNTLQTWWELTTNINLYRSGIRSTDRNPMPQTRLWSLFAKMNHNFNLPAGFTIQLAADYQGKTNLPVNTNEGFGPPSQAQTAAQGYIKAFYGIDMAIKKAFLKNNAASVSISVSDLFRSRRSMVYAEGPGFTQYSNRLNNPQLFRLNLSYRFGKTDPAVFKRKNMKAQNEGTIQDL